MKRNVWIWSIAAALVIAGALIGAQWWSLNRGRAADHATPDFAQFPVSGTSIGPTDAPVVVEEYFDFQCPHCHTAAQEVVYPVINRYVSRDEVRFVYRFYPILGPESVLAAEAASCAAEQERFWPYQQVLMEKRGSENRGVYSRANLAAYADEAGLDRDALLQCIDDGVISPALARDYNQALELGLRATPTFLVNGRVIPNPTLGAVEGAIREALAAKESAR